MKFKINSLEIGIEKNEGDYVYISHAHMDHAVITKKPIISSKETLRLLECCGINKNGNEHVEKMVEEITLHNSGHILGSTQIEINNGKRIVYTGDFKIRDGFTTKGANIIECDELYIDCTFSEPIFSFPKKEEIEEQIITWIEKEGKERKIIFGAYRFGKAQELIKLLNNNSIIPTIDQNIEKVCRVYEEFGITLKRKVKENMDNKPDDENDVFIFEMNKVLKMKNEIKNSNSASIAVLTGFSMKYNFDIKAFPLSDHADFSEILRYIKESKAKKVFCINGSRYLTNYLQEIGIKSSCLII